MSYNYQSCFSGRINDMLEHKAAMGRSIDGYAQYMVNFDRFCTSRFPQESSLTKELAFAWCDNARGNGGYGRAVYIRGFAKYLLSIGENAYMVPSAFYPQKKAALPYVFSSDELKRFFEATDRYPRSARSPMLEYIVPVIFRLQYACGLRPKEARILKRIDFNFADGTIYIAEAKHCKDRRLAVTPDVMKMCRKYDRIAESIVPGRTYFFPSSQNGYYRNPGWLSDKFHKCWELSENGTARGVCVPYDLRHNYATQTLMRWVEEEKDLNAWIPYLSAYMGHAAFAATFHYIHLLPERLSRLDITRSYGIIPEVDDEEEIE
jgi:integrase